MTTSTAPTSSSSSRTHQRRRRAAAGEDVWLTWDPSTPTRSEARNDGAAPAAAALQLGGLAAAALAAACGVPGAGKQHSSARSSKRRPYWQGRSDRHVNFANWPLYIDTDHESLKLFTQATGITVNYQEVIQDDPSCFAKVDPVIASGQYTGYDIMVITDGFQFADFIEFGECPARPEDDDELLQVRVPRSQEPGFDPGNTYSMPWASG